MTRFRDNFLKYTVHCRQVPLIRVIHVQSGRKVKKCSIIYFRDITNDMAKVTKSKTHDDTLESDRIQGRKLNFNP